MEDSFYKTPETVKTYIKSVEGIDGFWLLEAYGLIRDPSWRMKLGGMWPSPDNQF